MAVRLVRLEDIPPLQAMLVAMGQPRSEEFIKDFLADPRMLVVNETGGIIDGFWFAHSLHLEGLKRVLLGPGDAPRASAAAWLKATCDMGIFLEDEGTRRRPAEVKSQWWTIIRVWPPGPTSNCGASLQRDYFEAAFQFAPRTSQTRDGYVALDGGGREYWIRRDRLETKARSVAAVNP